MLRTRICYFGRNAVQAFRQKSTLPSHDVADLLSPIPSPKGAPILRKEKSCRTRLLQAIHEGIKTTTDSQNITSIVEKNLDTYIPRIAQPQNSYETVIRFLLTRNCIHAAIAVYVRMTELGFAVPLRLEARMLVALIVHTPSTETKALDEFGSSLQDIIQNKGFTNEDLWNILTIMDNHNFSPTLLFNLMNTFYDTHEPDVPILDLRLYKKCLHYGAESGDVEAGLRSLATLGHSRLRGPRRKLVNHAYASFIAGVRDTSVLNREAIASALDLMKKQGVQPNILVVNALISLEVYNNSLQRAFSIYHSVKHDPNLRPDDFTFGSLFNILNRLYNPKRRRSRHGRLITGDIPSPRTLYREMIEALLRKPTGLAYKPSTSLLNVILRSFIYKTDYVGALVALQCFTAFRVPVNVTTYKLLITHLMHRIAYGIRAYRKMGDDKWADRFLSLPYPLLDPDFLTKLRLGHSLMARILDVCRRDQFDLDWPLYAHKWQNRYQDLPVEYRVPAIKYIFSENPVSLDHPFDAVPLERLLRKAILCEEESMRELGYGEAAHSHISKVVADARVDMIPPALEARLELESQRKMVETEKAHEQTFDGFTKRRRRRKALRAGIAEKEGERAVVARDDTKMEQGKGKGGDEFSGTIADEQQRDDRGDDRGPEVTIRMVDQREGKRITWTRSWKTKKMEGQRASK
ncbi:hypothetical protein Agabi119p4_5245 [Agaricus bisporus var. burnettii]|uniref:Pentacotripeptide-repeat region of PRORP domain-containing protein n=1 Tax=Agaricus bisporus var. burnettii TaxID=192524 RepID=A0A8H7KI19_AGABI|nr:hypothetical protein Agabi119p4_5245 [Agaricus bisporus var. burnettii]